MAPVQVASGEDIVAAVSAKRNLYQVILNVIYHLIAINNLTGLFRMRASESKLNTTLWNMIEDAILGILAQQRAPRGEIKYVIWSVITDWLLSNFNKVELCQLVEGEEDVY